MEKMRLLAIFLAIFAMVGVTPASFAGSDRWIMFMTQKRMIQDKLIHVRFLKPDGVALESDALKQMVIREQNCSTGHPFEMITDYKMGFEPENKLVGIYLFPLTWENKTLCFSFPDIGKVEKTFAASDSNGHSIQLGVMP